MYCLLFWVWKFSKYKQFPAAATWSQQKHVCCPVWVKNHLYADDACVYSEVFNWLPGEVFPTLCTLGWWVEQVDKSGIYTCFLTMLKQSHNISTCYAPLNTWKHVVSHTNAKDYLVHWYKTLSFGLLLLWFHVCPSWKRDPFFSISSWGFFNFFPVKGFWEFLSLPRGEVMFLLAFVCLLAR